MMPLGDPCGFDGLAYLEFGAESPTQIAPILRALGFETMNEANSRSRWRQDSLEIIVDTTPGSFSRTYAELHGPALAALGLRVRSPELAWQRAINAGAQPLPRTSATDPPYDYAVQGMGGIALAFIDARNWSTGPAAVVKRADPRRDRLQNIDHLTFNVGPGQREYWNGFLSSAFGFQRVFEAELVVDGARTVTTVMSSPCRGINLACNEPLDPKSPLYRQMREFNGEGIQHLAFATADAVSLARRLASAGLKPLHIPSVHYVECAEQALRAGLDVSVLRDHDIMLAERSGDAWMLQHFTEPLLGPFFFEFVQRINFAEGFTHSTAETLLDTVSRLGSSP